MQIYIIYIMMLENLSLLIFLVQGFRFCEVNNANVISPNYFGQLTGQMFEALPYITFNISISPSLKKCISLKLYKHFYFYISILFSALIFLCLNICLLIWQRNGVYLEISLAWRYKCVCACRVLSDSLRLASKFWE